MVLILLSVIVPNLSGLDVAGEILTDIPGKRIIGADNRVRSTDLQPSEFSPNLILPGPTASTWTDMHFRPQWQFSAPVCSRCNRRHYNACNALEKRCHRCGQEGHFGRACGNIGSRTVYKTEPKRKRDFQRLREHNERKKLVRALPFSKLSDAAFKQCVCDKSVLMLDLKANMKKFQETIATLKTDNLQLDSKVKQLSSELEDKDDKIKFYTVCLSGVVSDGRKMRSIISEYQWLLDNYEMEHIILRSIKRNCVCRTESEIDREFLRKEHRRIKKFGIDFVLKS